MCNLIHIVYIIVIYVTQLVRQMNLSNLNGFDKLICRTYVQQITATLASNWFDILFRQADPLEGYTVVLSRSFQENIVKKVVFHPQF